MSTVPTVSYASFLDVAVCNHSNCQHAVKVSNLARHLRQVHKLSCEKAAEIQSEVQSRQVPLSDPVPMDRQMYLDTISTPAAAVTDSQPTKPHPMPLPPLPFLPIVQCKQCVKCGLIKQTDDSMQRHIRQCYSMTGINASDTAAPPRSNDSISSPMSTKISKVITVSAQSIFGGKSTAWFPIINEDSNTVLQLLHNEQGNAPGSATDAAQPHLDSFLSEMRFDVELDTYNIAMQDAYNATQWGTRPPYPYARRVLAAYLHQAFSVAAQKAYIKAHSFLDSPLRLALSTETLRTYITRLSRLLTFLFTAAFEWPTSRRVAFMTNAQHAQVTEFKHLCTIADSNLTPVLSKFHIIVRSIMFDPLETHQTVIPLFIACAAVKQSNRAVSKSQLQMFRFSNAQETSPLLAALKYLAKCAAVTHIYAFPRSATDRQDAWKLLSSATSEHADCGATVVASNLRCCHRLADTESHHIHMVLCTRHSMCGIVDGVELSLTQLGEKVHVMQQTAWSLLDKELLMGLRLNENFWHTLSTLQDALGEKSPGYWYLMHPHNYDALNAWRRAYVNAVHPHLFNADASVKEHAAQHFIKHAIQLQHQLFTLMQICSGGPARASEAATLRIRNTAKATRSIFISQGQLLTILTYSKTRSMQDGTGRAIVRCPDAVTAGMMHIYMLFIHPLHTMLAAKLQEQSPPPPAVVQPVLPPPPRRTTPGRLQVSNCNDNPPTVNPLDFVFDATSPDRLRTAFKQCLTCVSAPLTTTQYRHFHSAVVKNFLPAAAPACQTNVAQDSSNYHTLHIQAGHTEHTATKTYGVTRSQLTSLTTTELQQFRNASETWHRVLNLPTGTPIPFTQKKDPFSFGAPTPSQQHHNKNAAIIKPTTAPSASEPTAYSATGGASSNDMLAMAQIMARLDSIENNLSILLAKECSAHRPSSNNLKHSPDASSPSRDHVDGTVPSTATDANRNSSSPLPPPLLSSSVPAAAAASLSLQTFLQKPNACFSSSQQKAAVLHALQPGHDLLVVLPTGGGKSMLFMLPAFMKPDKICVVVVPLVSLQQDLIHRCAAKGITAARFTDFADTAGVRIVLVSAEHLVLPAYAAFLRTAAATQSLHAIFIDEAHLVLLWKHFRQSLQDVREFIRPRDVPASIIAMTATCPPPLEQRMSHACGMQDYQVLRSPTTRSNIRYSVREVPASSIMLAAAQLIARITSNSNDNVAEMRLILYIQNKSRCNALEHVFSLICPQIRCLLYHADRSDEQRTTALQEWQSLHSTKPRLMVATSAFGCGIDVPSVRCVVHLGTPSTVIDFLQESGRAGRDGMTAHSIILHTPLSSSRKSAAAATPHTHQHQLDPDRISSAAASNTPEILRDTATPSSGFGDPTSLCTTPKEDCRRWFIDTFADGTTDKRSCQSRNLKPCDHCEARFSSLSSHTKRRRDIQSIGEQTGEQGAPLTGSSSHHNADQTASRRRTNTNNATPQPQQQGITSAEAVSVHPPLTVPEQPTIAPAPTAAHLRDLAEVLYGTCPPCSIAASSLVRHSTQSLHCFNNRCLRCCGIGHKASLCPNLTLPTNTIGCYSCTLNRVNGVVVHSVGTYGKRSCQLKVLFGYCISMWENDRHKATIQQRIECTKYIHSTAEFVQWLRHGTGESNELGILCMVPVLQALYAPLDMPVGP